MSGLHLFRPEWLWALAVLPLLALGWWRRRRRAQAWEDAVDPHLLAHLLERGGKRGHGLAWLAVLALVIAALALAGPAWRQVAQPLWQGSAPLVVAMELSPAMLAGDLPPTRLAHAREKLSVLLARREGGQVGLVVYADDAFTVAPLTDDAGNVAVFLDSLQPDVMPVAGQAASEGIAHASRLLRQAGFERGRILVLASGGDPAAVSTAAQARAAGYEVSVLGIGTPEGAPYRGGDGQLHDSRLELAVLEAVAEAGDGRYRTITDDGADLDALGVLDAGGEAAEQGAEGSRAWVDEGFWLLPLLMLLVLAGFRRGAGLRVLVLGAGLGLVLAPAPAAAMDWWQRPDQARHQRMQQGTEAYRAGGFAAAAGAWQELDSADAHYNRGNALARQGRFGEAIAAYDEALARQPGMEDALANRAVVQAAMDQQPDGGGQPQDPGRQPGDPSSGQSGQPDGQDPSGKPGEGEEEPAGDTGQPGEPDDEREPHGEGEPPPADAADQEAADQAQRERMDQALSDEPPGSDEAAAEGEAAPETPEERERRIANEAWLQRVPDDPGGLLREKFRIEHERRRLHGGREN
ncbi:VWA domain-containing protein [Lysobacter sp. GX 14042]|uniref:VWA domain-containing protein n=1 Tax=Lysobacter sp. GX 14042 TaxID=2907155 RepID=UPI001F244411|nr:VWA domain-containing protein [Lysobacter sp. GX 14042]MCE7033461.1 VWA domain-containing protein [Lysobacter sp. GX 14042]